MEFEFTDRCKELRERLLAFMDGHIYPAEEIYRDQLLASGDPHFDPPIMEELKGRARPGCGICSTLRQGARASAMSSTPRWRRSWDAAISRPKPSIARRPTRATWRC